MSFNAGVDPGRAWELNVYADNALLLKRQIEAGAGSVGRQWRLVRIDLSAYAGQTVQLRLYQRVLIANRTAGNAYWQAVKVE